VAQLSQLRHPLVLQMPPVRPTTAGLLPPGAFVLSGAFHIGMDTFALDGELTLSMSRTQEELEALVTRATVGSTP